MFRRDLWAFSLSAVPVIVLLSQRILKDWCVFCADDIPPLLAAMSEDLLVSIADKLESPSDLLNLRLVDRGWRSAVGQSGISLRPHTSLTRTQLVKLSQAFRNAASLDLSTCTLLNNECLRGFHNTFPRLRQLTINQNSWLTDAGVANLGGLSHLESLTLGNCPGLIDLPQELSGLVSLQILNLPRCRRLRSLPVGISGLTALRILDLYLCLELVELPEGFGSLSLLQHLDLRVCR